MPAAGWLRHADAAASQPTTLALADVSLLPVIPNPGQIICVGQNYADHVRETGRVITETPTVFLRVPASQVGHGQDIVLPPESTHLDYEGEIAVIIGKGGRRISEVDSWSHIAGYAATTMAASAIGKAPHRSSPPARTSGARAASAPGWCRPATLRPAAR